MIPRAGVCSIAAPAGVCSAYTVRLIHGALGLPRNISRRSVGKLGTPRHFRGVGASVFSPDAREPEAPSENFQKKIMQYEKNQSTLLRMTLPTKIQLALIVGMLALYWLVAGMEQQIAKIPPDRLTEQAQPLEDWQ